VPASAEKGQNHTTCIQTKLAPPEAVPKSTEKVAETTPHASRPSSKGDSTSQRPSKSHQSRKKRRHNQVSTPHKAEIGQQQDPTNGGNRHQRSPKPKSPHRSTVRETPPEPEQKLQNPCTQTRQPNPHRAAARRQTCSATLFHKSLRGDQAQLVLHFTAFVQEQETPLGLQNQCCSPFGGKRIQTNQCLRL
jgi:hypothetical protein